MHETSVAEYVENHRDQRAGWQHLNKQKHQFDRDRTGKCHNLNDSGPEKAMKKKPVLSSHCTTESLECRSCHGGEVGRRLTGQYSVLQA